MSKPAWAGWHARLLQDAINPDAPVRYLSTTGDEALKSRNKTTVQPVDVHDIFNLVELLPPLGGLINQISLRPGRIPHVPNEVWQTVSRNARAIFTVDYILSPQLFYTIIMDMSWTQQTGFPNMRDLIPDDRDPKRANMTALGSLLDFDIPTIVGDRIEPANSDRTRTGAPSQLVDIFNDISQNVEGISPGLSLAEIKLVSLPEPLVEEKCSFKPDTTRYLCRSTRF